MPVTNVPHTKYPHAAQNTRNEITTIYIPSPVQSCRRLYNVPMHLFLETDSKQTRNLLILVYYNPSTANLIQKKMYQFTKDQILVANNSIKVCVFWFVCVLLYLRACRFERLSAWALLSVLPKSILYRGALASVQKQAQKQAQAHAYKHTASKHYHSTRISTYTTHK